MKVYMAGTCGLKNKPHLMEQCLYFLESFISIQPWQMPYFEKSKGFLLDSGAFTFVNSKKHGNLREYAVQYAEFIKDHQIKDYIELDVELVVGWDERCRINDIITGITKCEPVLVFHKNRGLDWYKQACKNSLKIAYGGIACDRKSMKKQEFAPIPRLIEIAHQERCEIHGLGFTSTSMYDKIRFDSVDSTTWTMGGRMGNACYFTGDGMRQWYPSKNGMKPKNINDLTEHNYLEWLKFQKYAEVAL